MKLDPSSHEAFLGGRKLSLTPAESQLTYLLLKNNGGVASKADIEQGFSKVGLGTAGSIKQHIMRLRRNFRDNAKNLRWFANVPGVGYRYIGATANGGRSSNGRHSNADGAMSNGTGKAA